MLLFRCAKVKKLFGLHGFLHGKIVISQFLDAHVIANRFFWRIFVPRDMKGLLDMTRRERRGMIVLLVAIALMLVVTVATRFHRDNALDDVNVADISRFEAEVDSARSVELKPSHPRDSVKSTRKRTRRPSAKPKSKPAREPRPIDPVPTF